MAEKMPDVEFVWVGGVPFGVIAAENGAMQRMMNNPPKNLKFTGVIPLDEVADYYRAADVFVLPSEQETFGLVVVEAAAAGLPVVLRDISDYDTTFRDGAVMASSDSDFVAQVDKLRRNKKFYSQKCRLAEKIAGSEKDFVDMMKAKLLEWGIQDATLVNSTGLNNETLGNNIYPGSKKDDENKLSAYDVAVVARNLILKYPQVLEITKKPSSTFAGMTIHSTNYMLEGLPAYRGGVDGLKTGTTDKAGASFVGTTVEKGMRIITVVLNADNQNTNPYARFTATSALLDYISSNFALQTIVNQGESYQDSKSPVLDGKQNTVAAVAKEDIKIVQRLGSRAQSSVTYTADTTEHTAPLEAGTVVGHLTYDDKDLVGQGYITSDKPTFDMVSDKNIEKAFFLKVWWNNFVRFINEKL